MSRVGKLNELMRKLAEIHNAASDEYSQAFNAVGARMWNSDKAHKIKKPMEFKKEPELLDEQLLSDYMPRPLTVLDSYPDVPQKSRDELDRVVDEIHRRYRRQWRKELKGSGMKYRRIR